MFLMVGDKEMENITHLIQFSGNIDVGSINQVFVPMMVPVVYADLLKLKMNTPIIMVESKVNTKNGRIYAYIRSFVNPNIKNIEITV